MHANQSLLARVAAVVFSMSLPLTAPAATPSPPTSGAPRRAQPPGVYRYRVGDLQITALSDGSVPTDLHALLHGTTTEEVDRLLHRAFLHNPQEASINAFLIDLGSRQVLVDTGAGSLFGPGQGGKLLGSLQAAGYAPEDIDDILLTHIHADHSGGLSRDGQRLFPQATVHVGKADLDFFLDPAHQGGVEGYDKRYFVGALDNVGPYVKANKVHALTGETPLFPGLKALPAPGHTPGHFFYLLESQGETVEFIGDTVHAASVQFPKPAITIEFDVSEKDAAAQRAKLFAAAARSRILIAAPHLPYPGLGHVRAEAEGYTFVPVEYRDRYEP